MRTKTAFCALNSLRTESEFSCAIFNLKRPHESFCRVEIVTPTVRDERAVYKIICNVKHLNETFSKKKKKRFSAKNSKTSRTNRT